MFDPTSWSDAKLFRSEDVLSELIAEPESVNLTSEQLSELKSRLAIISATLADRGICIDAFADDVTGNDMARPTPGPLYPHNA